jgi:16S rRNA (uracil1498-N3)-methyltransferase
MEYFYSHPAQITPTHCVIDEDEFTHLTHVMRRKEGDAIRIIDGVGTAYDAVIEEIARRAARCRITARYPRLNEPERHVTLGAAVLKSGSAYDFLVEKATELGVAAIAPLLTRRTIPRHDRTDRWQKIALAATKQCGRCRIPQVQPLMSLADFISRAPGYAAKIIPHEQVVGKELLRAVPAGIRHVVLCIGPEGGFTDDEVGHAVSAGFAPVSLGTRRLRAETAALVASALCLLEP